MPSGYGEVRNNGKIRRAHIVSYEQNIGQVPKGMDLDHLCRIRSCVNPMHLEPVSRLVNLSRSPHRILYRFQDAAAAVTHCPLGHPYDAENTYMDKRGCRGCKKCRQAASAAYHLRKKSKRRVP